MHVHSHVQVQLVIKNEVTDLNLSRSGSFDTGYRDLDDATSREGR